MFKLDSDILGLLFAIITFLLPVVSALLDRRKRKKRKGLQGELPEQGQELPDDGTDRLATDIDEIFDQLLGKGIRQQDDNQPEVEEFEAEELQREIITEDVGEEILDTVPELEAQPVAMPSMEPEVKTVEADGQERTAEGIKERLKRNPSDMVLFAEIMNPKFKEL